MESLVSYAFVLLLTFVAFARCDSTTVLLSSGPTHSSASVPSVAPTVSPPNEVVQDTAAVSKTDQTPANNASVSMAETVFIRIIFHRRFETGSPVRMNKRRVVIKYSRAGVSSIIVFDRLKYILVPRCGGVSDRYRCRVHHNRICGANFVRPCIGYACVAP